MYKSTTSWKSFEPLRLLPINVSPFSNTRRVLTSTGNSLTPNSAMLPSRECNRSFDLWLIDYRDHPHTQMHDQMLSLQVFY